MDFTPGSPEWWREHLITQLANQRVKIAQPLGYYDGDHRPVFADRPIDKNIVAKYQRLRVNYCELLVDVHADRMQVEGFRLGQGSDADAEAWSLWQRNDLDDASSMLHTELLAAGCGAALVWFGDDGAPEVSVESAHQVVVADTPGHSAPPAALKQWVDDWGYEHATLYLPDGIWRWQRKQQSTRWEERADELGGLVANPLGVVPVVPFRLRKRAGGPWRSVLADVISVQDAINESLGNMIVAEQFSAFRQKWATGIEIPVDPETGQPVEVFRAMIDRLWLTENPNARFGSFEASDLGNFVEALASHVGQFAAIGRLPAHYVMSQAGQWPTGDALRAAEMGLVSRVRRLHTMVGAAWERVMRLAFLVAGDVDRARAFSAETLWADPETRSESERADALVKRRSIGVPDPQLWLDAGYSQAQVAMFDEMVARQVDAGTAAGPTEIATAVQKVYLGVPTVLSRSEARDLIRRLGVDLPDADELPPEPPAAPAA